jgi:hypothetical protein
MPGFGDLALDEAALRLLLDRAMAQASTGADDRIAQIV